MAEINRGRWTAHIEGDFVVFLIGARFDLFHLIRSLGDLGGRRGMNHMLDYLLKHPEKGLLGYEMGLKTIVQYWRSFDHPKRSPRTRKIHTWTHGATTGGG